MYSIHFDTVQVALAQAEIFEEEEEGEEVRILGDLVQSDWNQLAAALPQFSQQGHQIADHSNHDWSQRELTYTDSEERSLDTWLDEQARVYKETNESINGEVYKREDGAPEQQLAIDKVHHCIETGEQLLMFLLGGAGVGKSWFINYCKQNYKEHVLITATTGKASFNTWGTTIHSAVSLPVQTRSKTKLKGAKLQRLQQSWQGIKLLFIDEISMLSRSKMGWLDSRLRQILCNDKPCGGLSIIFTGDFAQLPPVHGQPMFICPPESANTSELDGYMLYTHIRDVIILKTNHRQSKDPAFQQLLFNVRNGTVTREDWELVNTRSPDKLLDRQRFDDAVSLTYRHKIVDAYNKTKLVQLNKPIAHIVARNTSAIAREISSDDMWGLNNELIISIGARVMLRLNKIPKLGLANGSVGTVRDIVFKKK